MPSQSSAWDYKLSLSKPEFDPDWGTRILHAARGSARKKKEPNQLYTYVEITATAELYPQFTLI